MDGKLTQYQTDFTTDELSFGLHQITAIALWRDIEQTSEVLLYIGAEEYIEEPTIEFILPDRDSVLGKYNTVIKIFRTINKTLIE